MEASSTAVDHNIRFLREKLEKHLSYGPDREKPFARSGVPKHVLKRPRLEILFQSLLGVKPADPRLDELVETVLGTNASTSLCKILSIVLLACSRGTLKYLFIKDFKPALEGRADDQLPFDEKTSNHIFGDDEGPKFYAKQPIFTTIILEEGEHLVRPSTLRAPYLAETLLKPGSFAYVYKVKIEAGHFVSRNYGTSNESVIFAQPI
jgi:hypothetical protein